MHSLQVRDLPEHIYLKLQQAADQDHRSLAQEAVVVLARGLGIEENPKERRRKIIQVLRERPSTQDRYSDPTVLVREDRDR